MRSVFANLGTLQRVLLGISFILIFSAWSGTADLQDGLIVRNANTGDTPLQIILPEGAQNVPGVVIAHGFGGSKQLMLGYGYGLARAGYAVVLLDFPGHAANPTPMDDNLQDGLSTALDRLTAQPEVNPAEIALLGHSMGSGAVMSAGVERPEYFSAVIAVSPTSAQVSPAAPPNLLLQAGSLEPRFVKNAERLLAQAGGSQPDHRSGLARELEIIPGVEHITILFSPASRQSALAWLEETFERSSPSPPPDLRMLWYALHLIAWLLLGSVIAPAVREMLPRPAASEVTWAKWAAVLVLPYLVSLLFVLFDPLVEVGNLLGFVVGGGLALWFLILGSAMWVTVLPKGKPSIREILLGAAFFAVVWTALGLVAQFTWMQWFLIAPRLWRWPLIALAVLPWKLSLGTLLAGSNGRGRVLAWLVYSLVLVSALLVLAFFVPGMFVISLIAPVIPFVLGVEMWLGSMFRTPWSYGLGSALFFGWMIASFFPLG